MISIHKLENLPPVQRARKLFKVFLDADIRCSQSNFPQNKAGYLRELALCANLLSQDPFYSSKEQLVIVHAAQELSVAWDRGGNEIPRKPINHMRHLLSQKVGKVAADWDFLESVDSLVPKERTVFPGMHVFLEDIRSPFNIGSIFRSAECFGVESLYLSPLCASPYHSRAERSAMGCTALVDWKEEVLEKLDIPIFVLETGGINIDTFDFPDKGLMVLGSEELGVSAEALSRAERSLGRLSIPMYGQKASLNVSVAFGIAIEAWARARSRRVGIA